MKHSARITATTRMIRGVVIKDRIADVFMLQ